MTFGDTEAKYAFGMWERWVSMGVRVQAVGARIPQASHWPWLPPFIPIWLYRRGLTKLGHQTSRLHLARVDALEMSAGRVLTAQGKGPLLAGWATSWLAGWLSFLPGPWRQQCFRCLRPQLTPSLLPAEELQARTSWLSHS